MIGEVLQMSQESSLSIYDILIKHYKGQNIQGINK